MSRHPRADTEHLTRDDLRRVEARLDRHIQEANARIVMVDRHVATTGERIDALAQRSDSHAAESVARLRSITSQLEAITQRLGAIEQAVADSRPGDPPRRGLPFRRRPKHLRRLTP
jgi:hypothetical protein